MPPQVPSAEALFRNVDTDHSGKISKQEFAEQMGGDWNAEAEELWSRMDLDEDGEVELREMQYAMTV